MTQTNSTPGKKNNKKTLITIAITLVVAIALGVAGWIIWQQMQAASQAESAEINITTEGFSPATIKVKKGNLVTWTNNDEENHQILGDAENTDIVSDEELSQGDAYMFQFNDTGTFTYHDPLDPNGFKGTVIVE